MQADDTVITEKHFESLKGTSYLQSIKVDIRSFSGDGAGLMFSLIGCFMASLSQNQKSIIKVIFIVKGQGGRIKSASSKNIGLAYLSD